jgi:hypothetical protein
MGRLSLEALQAQRLRLKQSIDELLALKLMVAKAQRQQLRGSQLARVTPSLPNGPIRVALPDHIRQGLLSH